MRLKGASKRVQCKGREVQGGAYLCRRLLMLLHPAAGGGAPGRRGVVLKNTNESVASLRCGRRAGMWVDVGGVGAGRRRAGRGGGAIYGCCCAAAAAGAAAAAAAAAAAVGKQTKQYDMTAGAYHFGAKAAPNGIPQSESMHSAGASGRKLTRLHGRFGAADEEPVQKAKKSTFVIQSNVRTRWCVAWKILRG